MRTCHDASPRYFSILHDIPSDPIDPMATASLQIQLHHQQYVSVENPRSPDMKTPVLFMGTNGESLLVLGSAQAMIGGTLEFGP